MHPWKWKLPKSFMDEWLTALRSGNYDQGTGKLFYQGNYCCLGVACAISGIDDDDLVQEYIEDYIDEFRLAPKELIGNNTENNLVEELTLRNDGDMGHDQHSFDQIADWIELNIDPV